MSTRPRGITPAHPLAELLAKWRAEGKQFAELGAHVDAGKLMERMIGELETAWRAYETQPLSIAEAARESGYCEDHLRALVRTGQLRHTRPRDGGHIRIRRCDLPKRPDPTLRAG